MFERPELKVGALFIASFLLVGYMSMKVAKGAGMFSATDSHQIEVDDASGIVPNTAVKVAGVKVGIVKSIRLVNGRAILDLEIQEGLGLSSSVHAEFKTDGILGSKHIALVNGKLEDPPLKKGDSISVMEGSGSMGDMMSEVGKVAKSLNEVVQAIKDATVTGTAETPIGRIITNIEILTADLADVSSANKGKINSIIDKLDSIVGTLDSVMGDDSRGRVNEAFDNAFNGLAKFDESLGNVRDITDKINKGEGTIGRLVNDEETVNGINEAIENLNVLLGGAKILRTSFDYHSEIMTKKGDVRSFVGIKLQPGVDRYYEIAAVQDQFGQSKKKRIVREGTQTDDYTEEITYESKIKITALFAKNYYNFTFKGGLIQSTGGFGVDYLALNKKLMLSMELFDFSGGDKEDPNLRLFAKYDFYSGLYLVGGYNSLLSNDPNLSSPFFGAGLSLTNDDLMTLASFALRRR